MLMNQCEAEQLKQMSPPPRLFYNIGFKVFTQDVRHRKFTFHDILSQTVSIVIT